MTMGKKITYASSGTAAEDAGYEEGLARIAGELGRSHPLVIGGKDVYSAPEFEVRAPFDREVLVGKFQTATPALIREAVEVADRGFMAWQARDWQERAGIIRKAADLLEEDRYLLAALITYESGKNRAEALAEAGEAVDLLRYYAGIYQKNHGYVVRMRPEHRGDGSRSILRPYGAWAVISPFNFPLSLAAGMAGAALLTGNTVVLKPTSAAPFSVLKLLRAFARAGVPPGAVQYVTGPGAAFGEVVTAHPAVAGIAFTGSRDVGMHLQRQFAARQRYAKPVVAEMGSKNPVIVTAHADLEKAVDGVTRSAFGYSGQKCSAASRVYVQENIAGQFTALLCERAEQLVIGDPREKESFIVPLIDGRAEEVFRHAVAQARKDGASIRCGGEVLTGGGSPQGSRVQPTVVTGLPRDHPLAVQELFVPFLVVDSFATLPEALEAANASDYGLTAGIFSENDEELAYFFDHIRSGVTYANRRGGATTGAWPGTQAFCGWNASGSTGRGSGGPFYLLSFLREQAQMRVR
jgi:1-pyrroline-5-carboxylate dehydrogenase